MDNGRSCALWVTSRPAKNTKQRAQPTKYTSDDMIHFKVQQQQGKQVEAGEAWALPEKGGTTINSAIILGAIGEFHWPFSPILNFLFVKLFSQRINSICPSLAVHLGHLDVNLLKLF